MDEAVGGVDVRGSVATESSEAPGIFISHSSRDNPAATALRRALPDALRECGYRPLLDESRLDPGDVWRAKLYQWLAECEGGILLLTPEALTSDWVRLEASILVWRAMLHTPIRVVPVLLGTTREDVRRAFPKVPLDDVQKVSIPQ